MLLHVMYQDRRVNGHAQNIACFVKGDPDLADGGQESTASMNMQKKTFDIRNCTESSSPSLRRITCSLHVVHPSKRDKESTQVMGALPREQADLANGRQDCEDIALRQGQPPPGRHLAPAHHYFAHVPRRCLHLQVFPNAVSIPSQCVCNIPAAVQGEVTPFFKASFDASRPQLRPCHTVKCISDIEQDR